MQSGYGALNKLNYLLGVTPQTASGGAVGGSATPQGYDPSSGYRMGAGGGLGQGIPGGTTFGGSAGIGGGHQIYNPNMAAGQGAVGGSGLPVAGSGSAGGDGYGSLTSAFTPQDYLKNQDPGYGFQLQQGTQALRNAAGAGSGALSGAALKDLIGYNQDYASTGYSNAFNRFTTQQNNVYSRLSGLAGMGQASASNVGAQGTALAGQQSQALQAGGAAAGAGYAGIANAIGSGAGNYWLSQSPTGQKALGYGGV